MSSPVEGFVIALGRAASSSRFLLRGLRPADRDDVIATAIAWCWEHRASYDPGFSLDQWVDLAIRDARRKVLGQSDKQKREPIVSAAQFREDMAPLLPDPVAEAEEALSALHELLGKLTPAERAEIPGILDRGHKPSSAFKRKLAKMAHILPNRIERQRALRAAAPGSDDSFHGRAPAIDHAIGKASFPPQGAQDCPPCWRCKYFDGFKPASYAQRVTTPADREVQTAIWATEERKIEIANRSNA